MGVYCFNYYNFICFICKLVWVNFFDEKEKSVLKFEIIIVSFLIEKDWFLE